MEVVGCLHSTDEAGESRWRKGRHISIGSSEWTQGVLEAPKVVESYEEEIMRLARRHQKLQTLMHYVNKENLLLEHMQQKKGKASGPDGVTKGEYDEGIGSRLDDLLKRMKSFSYKPQPVRRTYIPKANGKLRPLGISSYEDRLVQGIMGKVLASIYETRFLDMSYGFRPNRSVHDAIKALNDTIFYRPIGWVVEADIRSFFNHMDHGWLMKFLRNDVEDENFLRYVVRFLKAGVLEEGERHETEEGSEQGNAMSPVLANVYLHYVLDLWFEKVVKRHTRGEAYLIRYADDFLACFQYEDDAQRFYSVLPKRLAKFSLEVAEEKTRIIPFGRNSNSKEKFDFLGFTHINAKTRDGSYTVLHLTSRKKLKVKMLEMKKWLNDANQWPVVEILAQLNQKLRGHYQFYGVSGNFRSMKKFRFYCTCVLKRVLWRRGQRHRITWSKFNAILKEHPVIFPRIYFPLW